MKVYQVGGAVRDALLGLPVSDRDWVVVGSDPKEMIDKGFKPVGKSFPVFLHPETNEEYALARTERKVGAGYHGFEFECGAVVSLEEDLARRDLTINAIAQDEDGTLIDPYGGQADCEARILRHVSDAFVEDPLRVLRVARFAARFAHLGFHVAPKTSDLMAEIVANNEMQTLVPERVWMEFEKALVARHPHVFMKVLREVGALQVVLPELAALYGVPQNLEHHPEKDTGIHTEMVLAAAAKLSDRLDVRFAAMTHDLGKAQTPQAQWPNHSGHEMRSVDILIPLCERLRVPKPVQKLAMLVAQHHGSMHNIQAFSAEQLFELIKPLDPFRQPERIVAFCMACEADSRGRLGFEETPFPQSAYLQQAIAAVMTVEPAQILLEQPDLSGVQIAEALQDKRIQALSTFIEMQHG